jgi:hypothetical protein
VHIPSTFHIEVCTTQISLCLFVKTVLVWAMGLKYWMESSPDTHLQRNNVSCVVFTKRGHLGRSTIKAKFTM